jgi:hypothetical protein
MKIPLIHPVAATLSGFTAILLLAMVFPTVRPVSAKDEPPANGSFQAGAAVIDITPQTLPVIINGSFTERTADKITSRLSVRAVCLSDGTTKLALAVVDSCMMPRDLIDAAKKQAAETTGIPIDKMMVSATHTHSAPSVFSCLGSRADPAYTAWLPGKIAEAIIAAHANLEPAEIGWGAIDNAGSSRLPPLHSAPP